MYLVDTNVLILAIDKKDPDYSFLQKIIRNKKLILSVIPAAEFLSQSSEGEEMELLKLLDKFPALGVDLQVVKVAAKYRKNSLKNTRVHLLDCILAAQAKLNNITLVTHNKADFPMKDIKVISP